MKQLLLLFLLSTLLITSCGDDDDDNAIPCDPADVAMTFVGDWNVDDLAGRAGGTVTFNADGTGSSSDGGLFETEANGNVSTTFDYELVDNETVLDLDYDNGFGVRYNITEVTCNRITFEVFGFNLTIRR